MRDCQLAEFFFLRPRARRAENVFATDVRRGGFGARERAKESARASLSFIENTRTREREAHARILVPQGCGHLKQKHRAHAFCAQFHLPQNPFRARSS